MKLLIIITILFTLCSCSESNNDLELKTRTVEVDGKKVQINTLKDSNISDEELSDVLADEGVKDFMNKKN